MSPQSDNVVRRLAAILAADVVSYSAMMGADEEATAKRSEGPAWSGDASHHCPFGQADHYCW